MAEKDLFQELKDVLEEFKDFLESDEVTAVKDVIKASADLLEEFGVPIVELIDSLVELLKKVKKEIQEFDLSDIEGLEEVAKFGEKIGNLANAIMALPFVEEDPTIKELAAGASSLDAFEDVKGEISGLIDTIVGHLNSLKP